MSASSGTVRMNLALLAHLVRDLRQRVPSHQRGRFVALALERELQRLRLQDALKAAAGAWQDADHPELADGPSIDRWIAESRKQLNWDRPAEA